MLAEYFSYQMKYEKEYKIANANSRDFVAVFMQNGKFFECYNNLSKTKGPNIDAIAEILEMQIARKKGVTDETNVYMLGFPVQSLNKHKKVLVSLGWNMIVIEQVSPPPNSERKVTGIYSPAMMENKINNNNNVMSIFIEEFDMELFIGLSVLDLMTGKGVVHETYSTNNDSHQGIDEITRWLITYDPKEILIYLKTDSEHDYDVKIENYIKCLDLERKTYYVKKNLPDKYFKLKKQNEFLKKIWNKNVEPIEYLGLSKLKNGIVSYIMCLQFAIDHNETIVNRLPQPDVYMEKNVLILDNNAPLQLNLIVNQHLEYGIRKSKKIYRCVFDVINKTTTNIGKRLLYELLLSPFTDSHVIEERLNHLEEIKNKEKVFNLIEPELAKICDITKYSRKILMGALHPNVFCNLDDSFVTINKIIECLIKYKMLNNMNLSKLHAKLNEMIEDYQKNVNIKMTKLYTLCDIKRSIFNKGYDDTIDENDAKLEKCDKFVNDTIKMLESYLEEPPKNSKNKNSDEKNTDSKINLDFNERDGYFLELTKKNAVALKNNIDDEIKINKIIINKKEIIIKERTKGKSKLTFSKLDEILNDKLQYETIMKKNCNQLWNEYLQKLYVEYENLFCKLIDFVGYIDVLCSGVKVANEFNYVKPKIIHDKDGCVKAKALRHPIVERLCIDSEYVPHNVDIGNKIKGNIIMGFNGVGKSVYMKSVGISVIMAQMGYYVPATEFEISPYETILARITGNDNFHKGQSSYVLEMSELASILKRANSKSLIVGDEVCRGTEWISGTSVVASTIETLSERGASFIFASHLHKLSEFDRIKGLKNVIFSHLTVELKNGNIIYHRELLEGSGPSIYGDIVAKHIIGNHDFVEKINYYKNEIIGEVRTSKYNQDLAVECCEICKNNIKDLLDTHHINFQTNCKNGFSVAKPHIKINEKYNLVILCKKCHCDVHLGDINIKGWKETSMGRVLDYNRQIILFKKELNIIKDYKNKYDKNDIGSDWVLKQVKNILKKKGIFVNKNIIKKIWFA